MPDRRLRGAAAPNARLTPEQVAEARRQWNEGLANCSWLAQEYQVSYWTMWRVLHHETYRDDPEEGLTDACTEAQ